MTTRINHLNKYATAPAGLPSSERFRLIPTGGIRLNADSVVMDTGLIGDFVNLIDGQTYGASSNMNIASVEDVNGVNVAAFDPSLAVTPTGYSLGNFGFSGVNTGQYTFAALWKVTDAFAGDKLREIIAVAHVTPSSQRATLREESSGALIARAQRTSSDNFTAVQIPDPVRLDGWVAAAAVFDWTNDTVTVYDLLGTESASGDVAGTSGAAPSDINGYRISYSHNTIDIFKGYLADYIHLPFVPTDAELRALKMHMQARAAALAGA